jgi:hypothetical protein
MSNNSERLQGGLVSPPMPKITGIAPRKEARKKAATPEANNTGELRKKVGEGQPRKGGGYE